MKKRGKEGFFRNVKAQVWVETVIYTLIAFVVLGAVLAFAQPKIQELQDQSTIEQSINMLQTMDSKIKEVASTSGNQRRVDLSIDKGSFLVDSSNNKVTFQIQTPYQYSESGQKINEGEVEVVNTQIGEENELNASIGYDDYNLTWEEKNQQELLTSSTTDYRLYISNSGNQGGKTKINFETA